MNNFKSFPLERLWKCNQCDVEFTEPDVNHERWNSVYEQTDHSEGILCTPCIDKLIEERYERET